MKDWPMYFEFLTRPLMAVLILVGVLIIARLLGKAAANIPFFKKGGRKAYLRPIIGLMWILGLILALQQIGVRLELINSLILIAAFSVLATLGLVFSLSTYHFLLNVITLHFAKGEFPTGSHVSIGGREGRVVELNPMYLILETEEGKSCIPLSSLRDQAITVNKNPDAHG